ncbi:MAG: IS66 family insertion sequence element accessory protein TnpB [Oscillospiraceae bacterium]|jgi:transposase|nr:IS66 family insertion sequence element accessory protein TnpB [Oscillospiraceae bacterium]
MIINEINADKVYLLCGATDMRRSINSLAAIVQQSYKLDLFTSALFLFCGRRSDRIKGLIWEGDGFILLYKVLERGRFRWPRNKNEALLINNQQLRWLMEGLNIEQPKAIKKVPKVTII